MAFKFGRLGESRSCEEERVPIIPFKSVAQLRCSGYHAPADKSTQFPFAASGTETGVLALTQRNIIPFKKKAEPGERINRFLRTACTSLNVACIAFCLLLLGWAFAVC